MASFQPLITTSNNEIIIKNVTKNNEKTEIKLLYEHF